MRRKLIQHGLSSLTVSLPKKWASEKKLAKGDEVEVSIVQDGILISAKKRNDRRKAELDVSESGYMLRRIVASAFKEGYDDIRVSFSSHDELKAIQALVREQFSGFEIVRQAKDSITIENLSENNFDEFDTVLKRFFFVLSQMGSDLSEGVSKDDFDWLANTALQKIETDKFADYCRRAINCGFESKYPRLAPLYTFIEQAEKVADRYSEMARLISSQKIKCSSGLKRSISKVISFEKRLYGLLYEYDMKKIIGFGEEKVKLQKELDSLVVSCPKKEAKVVTLLDRTLNLIFDLNGPIMAVNG